VGDHHSADPQQFGDHILREASGLSGGPEPSPYSRRDSDLLSFPGGLRYEFTLCYRSYATLHRTYQTVTRRARVDPQGYQLWR
jgi:hypothetical protein